MFQKIGKKSKNRSELFRFLRRKDWKISFSFWEDSLEIIFWSSLRFLGFLGLVGVISRGITHDFTHANFHFPLIFCLQKSPLIHWRNLRNLELANRHWHELKSRTVQRRIADDVLVTCDSFEKKLNLLNSYCTIFFNFRVVFFFLSESF